VYIKLNPGAPLSWLAFPNEGEGELFVAVQKPTIKGATIAVKICEKLAF
jgi:hypothetical protein